MPTIRGPRVSIEEVKVLKFLYCLHDLRISAWSPVATIIFTLHFIVRNELRTTTTCSDHGAAVSFTTVSNTQETSVDYVCTLESGETVSCAWKLQQGYLCTTVSYIVYLIGWGTMHSLILKKGSWFRSVLFYWSTFGSRLQLLSTKYFS